MQTPILTVSASKNLRLRVVSALRGLLLVGTVAFGASNLRPAAARSKFSFFPCRAIPWKRSWSTFRR